MKSQTIQLPIPTNDGKFLACYSQNGLVELNFPNRPAPDRDIRSKNVPDAKIRAWHRTTGSALKKMLAGKKPKQFPPLAPAGTEFQNRVWREMQKIPPGQTRSYGEIARAIGRPKAVRAVGGACGANPIPVLVPCHRVLAANKKIGGFSGGLDWKRKLLALEGIAV